jgi:hypothetical protein
MVAMDVDPPDPATLNPDKMGYRELQKACKAIGLKAQGKTEALRRAVQEYVVDPERVREKLRIAKEEKKNQQKQAKALWVDWKNHAAREILMEDLEPGGWLYDLDEEARVVFDTYKAKLEGFQDVPFGQFEARYKEATKKADKRRARSAEEEAWLDRDRLLHPRKSHNHRGEPVFDMDIPAKKQLRDDVKNKLHKRMTPKELWEYRDVYAKYKLDKFRPRIYQEIRRGKMLNWLNKQRKLKRTEYLTKKEKKEAKKKKDASLIVTFKRK